MKNKALQSYLSRYNIYLNHKLHPCVYNVTKFTETDASLHMCRSTSIMWDKVNLYPNH